MHRVYNNMAQKCQKATVYLIALITAKAELALRTFAGFMLIVSANT